MLVEEFTDSVEQFEAAFGFGFHSVNCLSVCSTEPFLPAMDVRPGLDVRLGPGGAWFWVGPQLLLLVTSALHSHCGSAG
jgi:hypothetical protein